jgi:circadian clock protein KaiB
MNAAKNNSSTKLFEEALLAAPESERYRLVLFVSGSTPRSLRAIQNIKKLCEERLHGRYTIDVIDAYQHPDHLQPEHILVTPTLIKKLPLPIRRIVGDLSDKERVLMGLDIIPRGPLSNPVAGHGHGG